MISRFSMPSGRTFDIVIVDDLKRSWTSIASSVEDLVSFRVSSEVGSFVVGHGEGLSVLVPNLG
jgi:hypothetical protein